MHVTKLAEFPSESELSEISYEPDKLVIRLGASLRVVFPEVVGFRVLDEGDLLEFWPACSARQGGLFRVEEGGWLSRESRRQGFQSTQRVGLAEFFVTASNSCVNVLSFTLPQYSGEPWSSTEL